jgi:hypothetical protein
LVASPLLCDSIPVEFKCVNVCRNTTVFWNCWRNQLHVSALFWVGHHQADTRISEKTHILQCGHQERGNEISIYNVWEGAMYCCLFPGVTNTKNYGEWKTNKMPSNNHISVYHLASTGFGALGAPSSGSPM